MIITYRAKRGTLEVIDQGHRFTLFPSEYDDVLEENVPASDASGSPAPVPALWAALLPVYDPDSPIKLIQMDANRGAFRVDGCGISPDDDPTGEVAEVVAALDAFYGQERDSAYAEIWRASQNGPVPPQPSPEELLEIKRINVLEALKVEYETRLYKDVDAQDISAAAVKIPFQNQDEKIELMAKGMVASDEADLDDQSTITFLCRDGVHTFLAKDFKDLAKSIEISKSALKNTYHGKKTEVEGLSTIQALNNYPVGAGWPS